MPSPDLVAAVDALAPASFSGHAYRHLAAQHPPLSGAGARTQGGRWNPPQSFSTLYLAIERETATNEFLRMAERAGRSPADFLPRRLYRYEAKLHALLDLTEPAALEAVELRQEDLRADDLRRCQAVGEAAQYAGREGIMAPSAAGDGTVLALFWDRLQPGSYVREVGYERWASPPTDPYH